MNNLTTDVAFMIIGGLIALLLLRFAQPMPAPVAAVPVDPTEADFWLTPYYLRYNVAVSNDRIPVLPQGSAYTYALGVPGSSIGARVLNLPGR